MMTEGSVEQPFTSHPQIYADVTTAEGNEVAEPPISAESLDITASVTATDVLTRRITGVDWSRLPDI